MKDSPSSDSPDCRRCRPFAVFLVSRENQGGLFQTHSMHSEDKI